MSDRSIRVHAFAGVLLAAVAVAPARAQTDYPSRNLTIIVAVAAGSQADMFARLIADQLSTRLGKGLPQYAVTDSGPDHSKRFHATVLLGGTPVAEGDGTSKKQAEMAAALLAWTTLNPTR